MVTGLCMYGAVLRQSAHGRTEWFNSWHPEGNGVAEGRMETNMPFNEIPLMRGFLPAVWVYPLKFQ